MANRPTVARYQVCGGQPPRLTSALFLAERIHLALVDLSDGSSIFTGCDSSRRPLQGHGHAHIFCECDPGRDGRGEITNVTVYARLGFGPRERAALESLSRIWGPDDLEVELALQKLGRPEDFRGCALLGKSRSWVSRTPFLSTRHAKAHTSRRGEAGCRRPADWKPGARSSAAAGGSRLSQACAGGAGERHDAGRAAGALACLPAPQGEWGGQAGGGRGRVRISDRVCAGGAGAGGGGVGSALWDGGI